MLQGRHMLTTVNTVEDAHPHNGTIFESGNKIIIKMFVLLLNFLSCIRAEISNSHCCHRHPTRQTTKDSRALSPSSSILGHAPIPARYFSP